MNRNTKLKAMDIVELFLDSVGDVKDKMVHIIMESSAASEFDADENDDDLAWAIAEYLNHLSRTPNVRSSFLNPVQDDENDCSLDDLIGDKEEEDGDGGFSVELLED